jgi:hypothetical protein
VRVDWVVEPRWGYARSGDLFEAHLGGRVLRGSAAASISGRMHPYGGGGGGGGGGAVGGHGHAAGPAPTAIGVNPGKIVHPSPNDPGLAKAKGFSNPTTAASLGGHPPQLRNNGALIAGQHGAATTAATPGHTMPQNVRPGETLTSTHTTTTTTTATTGLRPGANNATIHEQGAAAAVHPTTVAPRPTATAAATGAPPSRGGGKKR